MNPASVVIRRCSLADLPAVEDLYGEFAALHARVDPSFAMVPDHAALFGKYVAESLSREDATMLVAELDGEVVGFALAQLRTRPPVYPEPRMGWVDTVGVRERHQRKGVGSMLFQGLLRWFREQGVARIELSAAVRNERSTRFWRKVGFEPYLEQMYYR